MFDYVVFVYGGVGGNLDRNYRGGGDDDGCKQYIMMTFVMYFWKVLRIVVLCVLR